MALTMEEKRDYVEDMKTLKGLTITADLNNSAGMYEVQALYYEPQENYIAKCHGMLYAMYKIGFMCKNRYFLYHDELKQLQDKLEEDNIPNMFNVY